MRQPSKPISRRQGRPHLRLAIVALATLAAFGLSAASAQTQTPPSNPAVVLTVQRQGVGTTVPPGFVGLSFEFPAVEGYAGTNPQAIDPILVRLMRNLAPHGAMVLRIGGKSADAAWWPVHGMQRPGGVNFTVDRRLLAVIRALSDAVGHHLIIDLNLEAPSPRLPAVEAQAFLRGVGRDRIAAFEAGNEPEMWASWPWYRRPNGRGVFARPHRNYDYAKYVRDASRLAKAIPSVPSAGPTDWSLKWIPKLPKFLRGLPRLGIVTLHRYPLARCFTPWWSPQFPSIANLLWHGETDTLTTELPKAVQTAHAHHLPLRLDEFNSVSCSGKHEVSDTFATSLWSADALFALARLGVDGVNIHTFPGVNYAPFNFEFSGGQWLGKVKPLYYGLLMFEKAAPPRSELLRTSWARLGRLRAWATRGVDGRIRVLLINQAALRDQRFSLRIAGAVGDASVTRLTAPSLQSTGHVSIGGQSFAYPTGTGRLAGTPETETISPHGHAYAIDLAPASAALLTVGSG